MRRTRYALAALVFAIALGLAWPAAADDCSPLCAIYDDPWHPLYWFYNCRTCPPPSPEG
jgi:hypothetical protein